ncbi:MAG: CapA family protein, partial [Rhodanobacter sp.]
MTKDHLRFAFVGDVCLNFLDGEQTQSYEFSRWLDIKSEIGQHDFLVGNLECCLVDDRCTQEARSQRMATPAAASSFLRNMGFSDLSIANNHILDCGPAAIDTTREYLVSDGMRVFGAGSNLSEAEELVFAERNGCKVAFLSACDRSEYYASDSRAGIAPLEKVRLGTRVRAAAALADLVVVTMHADLEFSVVPGLWRQHLSHWLVEQGAHLVIQHHPHVLQGIERFQGGVIAYSLGNFMFRLHGNGYQEHRAGVFDSVVLVVDADLRGGKPLLSHRFVPVRVGNDHLPYLVTGPARATALHRMQELSSLVSDKRKHRAIWFRRCKLEALARTRGAYYALRREGLTAGMRRFWQLARRREDRRW